MLNMRKTYLYSNVFKYIISPYFMMIYKKWRNWQLQYSGNCCIIRYDSG